jgi:hypothetical protein
VSRLGEPNDSGPALSCIQSTRLRAGVNAFPICSISVNLHTFSKNIFREHVDGSQMVAGYRGMHHTRGEYRLQLFRHERVLSVLRARIRLEPHRHLRGIFVGASGIGYFRPNRRLPYRPPGRPEDALRGAFYLRQRLFRPELRQLSADALWGDHSRYRARFEPGLQHAHQRPHREGVS